MVLFVLLRSVIRDPSASSQRPKNKDWLIEYVHVLDFLFVCLGLASLWNIWGHITTVPTCSSGTLTNVLPHWNAMPQTQDTTPHPTPSQYTDTGPTCRCAIHWCGTSHWNTQLPILMSWVRPDREILPRPSTHTSERSTWCCHGGQQLEAQ